MVTICPYKIVLLLITVIFAALAAWYGYKPNEDSEKQRQQESSKLERRKKLLMLKKLRQHKQKQKPTTTSNSDDDTDEWDSKEDDYDSDLEFEFEDDFDVDEELALLDAGIDQQPSTTQFSKLGNLWTELKQQHPAAYNTCYILCVTLLIILHFEIFSGGYVCRQLFANKTNASVPITA